MTRHWIQLPQIYEQIYILVVCRLLPPNHLIHWKCSYILFLFSRWDFVCLCIHWVVQNTKQHLFLIHAVSNTTIPAFFFSQVKGRLCGILVRLGAYVVIVLNFLLGLRKDVQKRMTLIKSTSYLFNVSRLTILLCISLKYSFCVLFLRNICQYPPKTKNRKQKRLMKIRRVASHVIRSCLALLKPAALPGARPVRSPITTAVVVVVELYFVSCFCDLV